MEQSVKTIYPENRLPSARRKARVSAKLSPWLFLAPAMAVFSPSNGYFCYLRYLSNFR